MAVSPLSKYSAECLGSFMLTFCVGLVKVSAKTDPALGDFGPCAVGFCLMALVYLFKDISGGHFNPAVTFAVFVQKEIDLKEGFMYCIVQCAGAAAAGILAGSMYGYHDTGVKVGPITAKFALGAPIVEYLFTFLLCFTFLNVVVAKKKANNFYGLAIGFVIIAGGYGGGHISGGLFNPAITLGLNFMGVSWDVFFLPIYVAVQLAAAVKAVVAFHIVRPDCRVTREDLQGGAEAKKCVDKLLDLFDPEDTTEFLGTMFYTLCVSLNALNGNAGSVFSNTASFISLYLALGDISGGLFNPAITLACLGRWYDTGLGFGKDKLVDFKKSKKEGPKYMLAQLVGAGIGAALVLLIFMTSGQWGAAEVGCVRVPGEDDCKTGFIYQAFFAELFGTFFLAYMFLGVVTVREPLKEFGAFAIGAVILAGGYAFGPLSGGVLNPAVTAANSAFYKMQLFYTAAPILYFLGQCLGGVLAAVVFRFVTHAQEYDAASGYEITP